MKISFEKKIALGFIINLIVVLALGLIYWNHMLLTSNKLWHWISLALIVLSLGMLTVVFFIIKTQLKAKKKSEQELLKNEKLLQSIIDNTSNAISIKKINGEYLLINKEYKLLFESKEKNLTGKTNHEFLSKEIADTYRSSDLEVIKAGKEILLEEIIEQSDGPHTYLSVKFPLFDASNRVYAIGSISTDITERKKLQQSMVAGNTFFNLSKDMLIIASEKKFLKVNPATLKILGYTEKELLGKPFMSFVYSEDVDSTLKEVAKLQTGATTVNFENRYICKDGSLKWLNWTTFPDVKTGLLYAVARDVTINKEQKESLKAADTFFKISIDSLIVASKDKFIKINPALSKILGYSELELLSKPFSTYIFSEDLEITTKKIEKLKEGTDIVNFRNRWVAKDGSIKWLSWTATIDMSTHLIYAIARDITKILKLEEEEKEALQELHENEQKLNMILENISDGVLVANTERKVVMANYMANELFGTEDDSKISINFADHFDLYFPDEKGTFPVQKLPAERALNGESTDDIDVLLKDPATNKKRRVLLSGRPIADSKNNVIAAVVTIKDISRYKKMEEELAKTELKYRNLIGFKTSSDDTQK